MSTSEIISYTITGATAVAAIVFGAKDRNTKDRSELAGRVGALEATVQIMRRREIWHERKEDILLDALRDGGVPVPEMPPPPEVYPSSA